MGGATDGPRRRGDAAGGARAGGGLPCSRSALQRLLLRFLQSMHHIDQMLLYLHYTSYMCAIFDNDGRLNWSRLGRGVGSAHLQTEEFAA